MASAQEAAQAITRLKAEHDAVKQRLESGLPGFFGFPSGQVEVEEFALKDESVSGILSHAGQRYRFALSGETKELEEIE